MELKSIKPRADIAQNKKAYKTFSQFMGFTEVIKQQELTDPVIEKLNVEIDKANEAPIKKLKNQIRKSQLKMLQIIEKDLKLVPKNYYQNTWIAIGISAIGIPLGTVFGLVLDNMAYLGLGIPIGLAIGFAIGSQKDKKAKKENRQMNMEV
ncbi:hypothetical protein [Zunongwangia sp. HGR-M22]|uniref:hypothetical protein n=1 Tax=Zunongwangia sp. HGR-M22 TaxID=3015168 RepID=UPI0022DDDF80|nr:hypothetical protein [Zunongwangia sp. HGR-M22]WBL26805.1 hypothetical protein PBT91_05955 [Zunongwangia sp. HGR-M22]